MKKILFLHPAHYEQSMGGAEYQIFLLIDFLSKQQSNLKIYFIYEDNGLKISNNLGVKLLPLKKLKLNKRLGDRWFLHRKGIQKYLNEIRPDIIYTRFYSSWSGIAADYSQKNNCIHFWALASDKDVTRLKEKVLFTKPLNRIENKWVRYAYKYANHIITQNNFQQEMLKTEYGREGVLIRQSAEECVSNFNLKSTEKIRVCWIANLKPLKQPELFIQLANEFKEDNGIEFIMIGRSEKQYHSLLDDAKKTIPNFSYFGELSNDNVNNQLLSCHILVNTSEYEGFSNTFVQAWMRKVVVVSLNSNPDNLLSDNQIGFLASNFDNMCSVLRKLTTHPDLIISIGEAAYSRAMTNHSYEKNMKILIRLMKLDE